MYSTHRHPPITNPHLQSRLYGLLRNSDIFVLVADLGEDTIGQTKTIIVDLESWEFAISGNNKYDSANDTKISKYLVAVANKADIDDSPEKFEQIREEFGERCPVLQISGKTGQGLEQIASEIFNTLNAIRGYIKSPSDQIGSLESIVLPTGSTVGDAAGEVHREWTSRFNYALL